MKTKWANCCAPNVRLPDTTLGETECVLLSDWTVSVRGHTFTHTFTIPASTTTDGASIPRFLWRLCGHPYQVPRAYAALLHDFLYRNGWRVGISRKEADECYYAVLRHFGVAAWRAGTEYYALRVFGGAHYNKGFPAGAGNAGGKATF